MKFSEISNSQSIVLCNITAVAASGPMRLHFKSLGLEVGCHLKVYIEFSRPPIWIVKVGYQFIALHQDELALLSLEPSDPVAHALTSNQKGLAWRE